MFHSGGKLLCGNARSDTTDFIESGSSKAKRNLLCSSEPRCRCSPERAMGACTRFADGGRRQLQAARRGRTDELNSREAQEDLDALQNSLLHRKSSKWIARSTRKTLKDHSPFSLPEPVQPNSPMPREPDLNDQHFQPVLNLVTRLIPPIRDKERARMCKPSLQGARQLWLNARAETEQRNKGQLQELADAIRLGKQPRQRGWRTVASVMPRSTNPSRHVDRRPEAIANTARWC